MGAAALAAASLTSITNAKAQTMTDHWDKVFPRSENVNHEKVTFTNRYGITLVGDLYMPSNRCRWPSAGARRRRTVRRREGAIVRPLCADHG